MTLGFSELVVGDSVELKGPIGHFIWKGAGIALLHGKELTAFCEMRHGLWWERGHSHFVSSSRHPGMIHHTTTPKVWVLDVNRAF